MNRRIESGRALVALMAACVLVSGCLGNNMGRTQDDGGNFTVNPACDPDGMGPCPDDWFVCTQDDVGNKRCEGQSSAVPDDEGSWDCEVVGDELVCTGDHMPDGGGWDCEEAADGTVTCRSDAYEPGTSPDGGAWDCWYEGDTLVCESGDYEDDEGEGEGDDSTSGGGADGSPSDEDLDGDAPPGGSPDFPDGGGDICFYDEDDPDGPPLVRGFYGFESVGGRDAIHISLVFNTGFVDNTYGANSSDGYRGGSNGHRFRDLVSSDHAEVGFLDSSGREVLLAKFDYITGSDTESSGYDCLGVTGGDGSVLSGDGSAVLAATSSLDRNLNELGCVFLEDSPTPEECPEWEYRVVYEMWIALDVFGSAGFGQPALTYVHASPARTDDTIPVVPGPCP